MQDDLANETPVTTTKPARESTDWTAEAKLQRRWGLDGKVTDRSDRHGVCYEVTHKDGTKAWYERRELRRSDVHEYTVLERAEMIEKMRAVTERFYGPATETGVHAFIEFCGLMNEFIVVCQNAQAKGIDFTMANTHSGISLPFEPHHAHYLAEKLNCIYGPALFANKEVRNVFIGTLFEGEFKLTPTARTGKPDSKND